MIPIRIPLNCIAREPRDFVTEWLQKECRYTLQEIDQLKHHYRLLLLLDGYDELIFNQGQRDLIHDTSLGQWPGSIVISCRSQQMAACRGGTQYFLAELTTAQIKQYVKQRLPGIAPRFDAAIESGHPLKTLLQNPLLLVMVTMQAPILENLLSQTQISRYQVYAQFMQIWFVREFERLQHAHTSLPQHLYDDQGQQTHQPLLLCAEQVALQMFRDNTVVISAERLNQHIRTFLRDSLQVANPNPEIAALRSTCPLKAVGESQYQLMHKSFQEFLVAQALLKALPLTPRLINMRDLQGHEYQGYDDITVQLCSLENNLWNQLELSKESGVLAFLSDVQPNPYRLLQIIYASRGVLIRGRQSPPISSQATSGLAIVQHYESNPHIAQAAGNAISLFVACGYSAASLNLDYIQVKNANVSRGLLNNISAQHSKWENVVAIETNWAAANITDSQFNVELAELPHLILPGSFKKQVNALIYVNNQQLLAGYNNGLIVLWDIITCCIIQKYIGHKVDNKITALLYIPTYQLIISAAEDKTIKLWDCVNGRCKNTLGGHKNSVNCLSYCAEKKLLASGSDDKSIRLWKLENNDFVFTIELKQHTQAVTGLAFCPEKNLLISSGDDQNILLWNLADFSCTPLGKHDYSIKAIAVDNNRQTLISGDRGLSTEAKIIKAVIKIWDLTTKQCQLILEGYHDVVRCLMFNPHDNTFASGDERGYINLWKLDQHLPFATFVAHSTSRVSCVCYSPDGNYLSSGGWDDEIHTRISSRLLSNSRLNIHASSITALLYLDGAQTFASASHDYTIRLWNSSNFHCTHVLRAHTAGILCLAYNKNRRLLASGGYDRKVYLWKIDDGSLFDKIDHPKGFANEINLVSFDPSDKNLIISVGAFGFLLWDITNRRFTNEPGTRVESGVNCLAYHPKMPFLLCMGWADKMRICTWHEPDRVSWTPLHYWDAKQIGIKLIAHPSGEQFASGHLAGVINLWRVVEDGRFELRRARTIITLLQSITVGDQDILDIYYLNDVLLSIDKKGCMTVLAIEGSETGHILERHQLHLGVDTLTCAIITEHAVIVGTNTGNIIIAARSRFSVSTSVIFSWQPIWQSTPALSLKDFQHAGATITPTGTKKYIGNDPEIEIANLKILNSS